MKKRAAGIISFVLGKQGARNAAIINTALSSAGKILGYARTLVAAYLFGVSPFVDAYYIASGSIAFICSMLERSMEAAIMPKLVQSDEDAASSLFALAVRTVIVIIVSLSLLIFIFPRQFILLFVRTLDPQRVTSAAHIARWLLPWGIASVVMSLFSVWANYRNRFSAPSAVYALSNTFVIAALLLFYPFIGETALPASQSAGFAILAVLMWLAVGGVPLRRKQRVGANLKKAAVSDALFSMVWSGSVFIYALVDRYFASSLPVGNVSAISYAQLIFQHPLGVMGAAFTIYFVRASEAAKSPKEGESLFFTTLFMAWSYFVPVAILLFILANPLIKLLLGYGAFDARAVALTAPCLAATALGLPILMCNMVVGKHALANGRLKALVVWSYVGVVGNAALDWLFVKPFGAPGLCAATSIMWYISTLCLMAHFAPSVLIKLARAVWIQIVIAAAWALPLYFVTRNGIALPLLMGAVAGAAHILLCEKFGVFERIPLQWRVSTVLATFYRRIFRG